MLFLNYFFQFSIREFLPNFIECYPFKRFILSKLGFSDFIGSSFLPIFHFLSDLFFPSVEVHEKTVDQLKFFF